MSILINPGAGPIAGDSNPEQAAANVETLALDVAIELDARGIVGHGQFSPLLRPTPDQEAMLMGGTRYSDVHDGRWPFLFEVLGKEHVLEMPGLPLDQVRFMKLPGQSILDFPSLFIDGSSWIWSIAVSVLVDSDE